MNKYEPSKYTAARDANGRLWPCTGLASLVAAARAEGWTVAIDLGPDGAGDPEDFEEITFDTARLAVQEVDEALLRFIKEGERTQRMLVIPSNGEDWCCDYTLGAGEFLDRLVHKHVYKEPLRSA